MYRPPVEKINFLFSKIFFIEILILQLRDVYFNQG